MTKVRATTSSRVTDRRPPAAPRGNGGRKPPPTGLDFRPSRGGGGVWKDKRTGQVVGRSKTEDSPMVPVRPVPRKKPV